MIHVYIKAFLLKMDRAKCQTVVVVVKALFLDGNHVTWYIVIFNGPSSTPANHQRESIASILPVVSTIIATVCRTRRHNY